MKLNPEGGGEAKERYESKDDREKTVEESLEMEM
jgi:hypothetical protein